MSGMHLQSTTPSYILWLPDASTCPIYIFLVTPHTELINKYVSSSEYKSSIVKFLLLSTYLYFSCPRAILYTQSKRRRIHLDIYYIVYLRRVNWAKNDHNHKSNIWMAFIGHGDYMLCLYDIHSFCFPRILQLWYIIYLYIQFTTLFGVWQSKMNKMRADASHNWTKKNMILLKCLYSFIY